MRAGLLSDTHGLLRPEALAALAGVAHILHAGDIGRQDILRRLAELAPVTAVRGNIDEGGECAGLPLVETVELEGVRIRVIHDLHDLHGDPAAEDVQVLLFGHTHRPLVKQENGVLFVNPGSAGPRRFTLPVSVGLLHIDGGTARAELIDLPLSGRS